MERSDALDELRRLLPPGTTVYTILRHVSRSGMSRSISAVVIEDGAPRQLDYLMVAAGIFTRTDRDRGGIVMGGFGMDMGFHLVYSLASALYPDGYRCIGEARRCPSNDHSNDYGRLTRQYDDEHGEPPPDSATHEDRVAYVAARQAWIASQRTYHGNRRHGDGGYALTHRWL